MYRFFLLIVLFSLCVIKVKAAGGANQTQDLVAKDSLSHGGDSVLSKPFMPRIKPKKEKIYHPDSTHSPHTAVIRSLIFPGLGQIYNRHGLWWRLPVIYGGLSALMYNIISNGRDYNIFLQESVWRERGRVGPEPLPVYTGVVITNINDQTIYDFKDNLRRNRDLSIIGFVAAWGVNAIDAYVEAKFIHSYTMDNDLSFKINPSFMDKPVYASNFNTFTPGIKLTITF